MNDDEPMAELDGPAEAVPVAAMEPESAPAAPVASNAFNPDWLPPATEGTEYTREEWHGLELLVCARCGWEKVDDRPQFDRHLREYHQLTLPEAG